MRTAAVNGLTTPALVAAIDRAGTPVAKIIPLVRRVNRTAVGSLAGRLDLSGDWDSPETNAEIAADFGFSS
jgi:antitoxin (DNA-binding transcriptional repressor) of toxin-antitoxin stability system